MNVYLQTFGCRANQYDSELVRALVEGAGGQLVADPALADVAVFNSCAVTGEAVADLRQQVRRVARRAPQVRSVVMGCAAALDTGEIAALPQVSHVLPGAEPGALAAALELPVVPGLMPEAQTGARGLLRIQDGCDEHCTFCATTLARGAHRSRPLGALVEEARRLAAHHREIVLTGIHIGSWGSEWGTSLGTLVAELLREVPSVRFRLSSVEATEVDDTLLDLFGSPNLAPHLHAPLQSGSDVMLRRMGRHWYTAATYRSRITRLMCLREPFALGADIITGFPGERDADHHATVALVQELPFTYLHVFPWSPRPGTAALRLADPVPPALARERAAELRALGEGYAAATRRRRAGSAADVVVVTGAPRTGLTEDYLTVRCDGTAPGRGERFSAILQPAQGDDALVAIPISA